MNQTEKIVRLPARPIFAAWTAILLSLGVSAALPAADDPTLDWLLASHATTAPTSRPADTRPSSPLVGESSPDSEARTGAVTLSTGQVIKGRIRTTAEKPLRIWDDQAKEYRDVPMALVKSLEAKILWERDEKEWHFKESGSDVKEYSGKTYPARELQYTVTLLNDQTITGGIVAPLYVKPAQGDQDDQKLFVLNKRQKGEIGQTLKDLAYVKRVDLE